jgi:hypothetical protein
MTDKAKLIFLVLTICGTLCILGALVVVGYLYQQNSATLAVSVPGQIPQAALFFGYVIMPAALTFLAGGGMITAGTWIGVKSGPR